MTATIKFCKKCGTDTERTTRGDCKPCAKRISAAYYAANANSMKEKASVYRANNPEKVKACRDAYATSNVESIKARAKKYQLLNSLKIKEYQDEYRKNNHDDLKYKSVEYRTKYADKVKASQAAYYKENRERIIARNGVWAENNKSRVSANMVVYRLANQAHWKTYLSDWRKSNAEKCAAYRGNRRARILDAGGTHTGKDIQQLFTQQRGKCACCKVSIKDGYHIDHIMPLALGGSNDKLNLQLTCPTCNLQKRAKHPIDFMQQRGFLL